LPTDPSLAHAFSVQALSVARIEAARRANYGLAFDRALHDRLTAAQGVLLRCQAALEPLVRSAR
jgi:hypothetical protein